MIKVLDIINKSVMTSYEVVSGENYLQNEVSSVVILEYESIANKCAGFHPGQFVLASYFLANESGDIINQALSHLIRQKVAAVAIKISVELSLPDYLLELVDEYHVPIIRFDDVWIEDLLININDILSSETGVIYEENLLRSAVLPQETHSTFNLDALKQLWPDITSESQLLIAYISSTDKSFNALRSVETLSLILHRQSDNNAFHFFKYGNDMLLMHLTNSPADVNNKNHFIMRMEQLLRYAKLSPTHFHIGIFDMELTILQLPIAIQKAKEMNIVSLLQNEKIILYSSETKYKYIFTLYNDPVHFSAAKEKIYTLKKFDESNHTSLLSTLTSLTQNDGDYQKTADQLYSHINTIRYRQKKALEIINLSSATASVELDILIKMYIIHQITSENT